MIEDTSERVMFCYSEGYKRNLETKRGSEGIWYDPQRKIYLVGYVETTMQQIVPRGNKFRRLHFFQGENNFNFEDFGYLMRVCFVRNK